MTALREIFLYLHLVGFAVLLGGAVTQLLSGKTRINAAMLWGSVAQVVTGIALAGVVESGNHKPDPAWLVVKLVVALMIFAMTFFSRKREEVNRGHFLAILGLTLANAAVAVFWH